MCDCAVDWKTIATLTAYWWSNCALTTPRSIIGRQRAGRHCRNDTIGFGFWNSITNDTAPTTVGLCQHSARLNKQQKYLAIRPICHEQTQRLYQRRWRIIVRATEFQWKTYFGNAPTHEFVNQKHGTWITSSHFLYSNGSVWWCFSLRNLPQSFWYINARLHPAWGAILLETVVSIRNGKNFRCGQML